MKSIPREKRLAKPEMKKALAKIQRAVREVLPAADFAEQEQVTLMLLDEAGRGVLERRLAEIAASFDDEVLVDGVPYKRHEEGTETYYSLSGPLVVARHTFRQMGVRNGPTVVPLELVAGIVEGATPALGYNVAHGYAEHDMRQHGEALVAAHRAPPPRATLERLAKRIAVAATEHAPRIEAKLRRTEKVPEGAHAISVGLDRTSAPMAELRPEDAPPKPEPKRTKPRVRCAPAPIDVNYRMAYVGTVSIVDAEGHALETRRYAAPACDDPATLASQMRSDVRALLGRCPTLHVGIVQDGAPEMWSVLREGLAPLVQQGVLDGWHEGIDRCHLVGRLNTALEICGLNAQQRAEQLSTWTTLFDHKDSAIDSIERDLRRRYAELDVDKQKQLWEHLVYLRNNKDRMRYVTLAVRGLPIGSGATESAAKTVIGQRATKSGQHWSEPGLGGVLCLRAIHLSNRLPAFWTHLARRYKAEVKAA
ncbi:MAG TPA: hypothetical protein VHM72_02765 [Solirubrobacteraceae bacterium]|jgi:hypothetical protein|nr:hypothetical protein [Solirubrobacteraceae bacterium]